MAIEIVDLPIKNGDFHRFFVCVPGRVKKKHQQIAQFFQHQDFTTVDSALLLPLARFRVPHLSPRRAHDGTGRVHHTTHNLTSAMDGHWAQQKLAVSSLPWMAIWCHLSLWSSLIIQLFQEVDLFRHSAMWSTRVLGLLPHSSPLCLPLSAWENQQPNKNSTQTQWTNLV